MLSSLVPTVPLSAKHPLDSIDDALCSSIYEDIGYCGGAKVDGREGRIFHYEEADIHCTTPETDQELLEIFGSSCSPVIAYEEEELKEEMVTHVIRRKSKRLGPEDESDDRECGPLWSDVLRETTKSQNKSIQGVPSMAAKSKNSSKDEDIKKSMVSKALGPEITASLESPKAPNKPPRPPLPVAPNGAWIEVKRRSPIGSNVSRQTEPKRQVIILPDNLIPKKTNSLLFKPKTETVKPKTGRSPKPRSAKNRDRPYEPRTTITNAFDEVPIPPRAKQPLFTPSRIARSFFLATLACLTIAPCL